MSRPREYDHDAIGHVPQDGGTQQTGADMSRRTLTSPQHRSAEADYLARKIGGRKIHGPEDCPVARLSGCPLAGTAKTCVLARAFGKRPCGRDGS